MAALAASIMALFSLRFYLAVLLGPALGVALLLGRRRKRAGGKAPLLLVRQAALAAVFIAVMVAVGFTGRAQHVAPTSFDAGLEKIQISRNDLAGANSGYLPGADVSTPDRAVAFLPVGLVYFLTLPLPWQIGPLRQNLVIPETLLWILLYPLVALGATEALKKNFQGASLLLLVTGAMCALYALFSGNVGVTYRMRIQVWLLWAVFAGWGWQIWSQRRGRRRGRARRGVVRRFRARFRNSDGVAETLGRDRERLPLR
ncbi:MAG TPA: hypothetical protein VMP01_10335 [Pirellulaceae bacterium]|nr:hypothetical protein [Pirellulaceae bacterium]